MKSVMFLLDQCMSHLTT